MKMNFYGLPTALLLSVTTLVLSPKAEAQLITQITEAQMTAFRAEHKQTKVKHYTNGHSIIDYGTGDIDTGAIIAVDPVNGMVELIQTDLQHTIFKTSFQLPHLPLYGKPVAWTRIVANPSERSFTSRPRLTIRRDIEKLPHELKVTETFGIQTDKAGAQTQVTLSSLTAYVDAKVEANLISDGRSLKVSLTNKSTNPVFDIYQGGKKLVLGNCKYIGDRTIECIQSSNGERVVLYEGTSYQVDDYDYQRTVTPLSGSSSSTLWFLNAQELYFKPIIEDNSTTLKLPENIKGAIKHFSMDVLKDQFMVTTTTGQVAAFSVTLDGRKTKAQFTRELPVFAGRFSVKSKCNSALE